MRSVSVEEARERLDELLDEIEGGGEVLITRAGAPVARVSRAAVVRDPKAPLEPIDWARIDALRESTPMQKESAGDFVRRMRDDYRY